MKFQLLIAMCALIGFSSTSAAAVVNVGDKDMSDAMEGFKESLKRIVLDVSKQIKENADSDENIHIEKFIEENKFDHDGEASILTEEEWFADVEQSAVEDDKSTKSPFCHWRGQVGVCCANVTVSYGTYEICTYIGLLPPDAMKFALFVNRALVWRHRVVNSKDYTTCLRMDYRKICISMYKISIDSKHAAACFRFQMKVHYRKFTKEVGCFSHMI